MHRASPTGPEITEHLIHALHRCAECRIHEKFKPHVDVLHALASDMKAVLGEEEDRALFVSVIDGAALGFSVSTTANDRHIMTLRRWNSVKPSLSMVSWWSLTVL